MALNTTNRHGWWGILAISSVLTLAAVSVLSLFYWVVDALPAAGSALLAGIVVWLLSALTIVVIAATWKNKRHLAIPLTMGAFIVKLVLFGLLLAVVPTPQWLQTVPAAIGALVSILAWQAGDIYTFMRTRHQIYED